MNNNNMLVRLLPAAVLLLLSGQALAGITLYDSEGTSFSTDGLVNAFYTQSSVEGGPMGDRDQSRVRMGFCPTGSGSTWQRTPAISSSAWLLVLGDGQRYQCDPWC